VNVCVCVHNACKRRVHVVGGEDRGDSGGRREVYCAESVGDDNRRSALRDVFERALHRAFALRVERRPAKKKSQKISKKKPGSS